MIQKENTRLALFLTVLSMIKLNCRNIPKLLAREMGKGKKAREEIRLSTQKNKNQNKNILFIVSKPYAKRQWDLK